MAEQEIDEHSGVETTGHEWDGIKELNNPLPRWWLLVFYGTIAVSIVYWILMPSWPGITGYAKGLRNYSERDRVENEVAEFNAKRAQTMNRLLAAPSIADIEKDPDLLQYTLAAGGSIFGDNCATCHGAGGQGAPGFPNLNDDDWLWGGSFSEIEQTIRYGVRSGNPKAHVNVMQAYGKDGVFKPDQISDLVEYVVSLSGREADPAAVARAAPLFAGTCAACHGPDGKGNQSLGAPNLTDDIWLYGGDRKTIRQTLMYGRGGVMPAWADRLSEEQITALAVYVHSLGGGQ
ncbi:MAG: cytochrome-c oxidase, cbb3-type subunit III [Alphaproteobacteria bacterium]|nr:cytochrome-c oxidase, cbb3-type subunit III [Alphaproteobacteria bacterium]